MNKVDSKIAAILRNQGLLDQFQYQAVLDHLNQRGGRFHVALQELGLVSGAQVIKIVANVTGLPPIDLDRMQVNQQILDKLPLRFCEEHLAFPCAIRQVGKDREILWVAMSDPSDSKVCAEAKLLSDLDIRPLIGQTSQIRSCIQQHYASAAAADFASPAGAIDLSLGDEEEEFKVTDLSGSTAVKNLKEIRAAAEGPANEEGQVSQGDLPKQIQQLLASQEEIETTVRAFMRLLINKGLFEPTEFLERMKK